MTLLARLVAWLTREPRDRVSSAWLREQARAEGTVGWEGPRWRLKKERVDGGVSRDA